MPAGPQDVTKIKEDGWRQGSALPSDLVDSLSREGLLQSAHSRDDLLIVLSHHCDVTSSSLAAEPFVELLSLKLVSKRDGNLDWGKNPRRYQFVDSRTSPLLIYEVSVHDRVLVPRDRLLGYKPDSARAIDDETRSRLCRWVAARYTRSAFPDSFNERVGPAVEQIRPLFKRAGHLLTGVYLLVVDDELPEGESYRILLIATMLDEDYRDASARASAQELLDRVEAIMHDCDGVDIGLTELRSEAELSLHEIRTLKRWDFD
ncbi:MAG: hypothetical protein FJ276_16290, partial [Planctomycetes bacterium]|nr:hypothetical protein [Planctomycetota bacterium]